jgi:hypothetical protein
MKIQFIPHFNVTTPLNPVTSTTNVIMSLLWYVMILIVMRVLQLLLLVINMRILVKEYVSSLEVLC